MMAGSRQNLQSLTQQMDSLSTELNQTKYEIFVKLEVKILKYFVYIFNIFLAGQQPAA